MGLVTRIRCRSAGFGFAILVLSTSMSGGIQVNFKNSAVVASILTTIISFILSFPASPPTFTFSQITDWPQSAISYPLPLILCSPSYMCLLIFMAMLKVTSSRKPSLNTQAPGGVNGFLFLPSQQVECAAACDMLPYISQHSLSSPSPLLGCQGLKARPLSILPVSSVPGPGPSSKQTLSKGHIT